MVIILAAIILLLLAVLLMQRKKEANMRIQINRLNEQLEMLKTASSEKTERPRGCYSIGKHNLPICRPFGRRSAKPISERKVGRYPSGQ